MPWSVKQQEAQILQEEADAFLDDIKGILVDLERPSTASQSSSTIIDRSSIYDQDDLLVTTGPMGSAHVPCDYSSLYPGETEGEEAVDEAQNPSQDATEPESAAPATFTRERPAGKILTRQYLGRVVSKETRKLAEQQLGDDEVLWRWAAVSLFTTFRDEGCHLRVLPEDTLRWIWGDRYVQSTQDVLDYVADRLDIEIVPYIHARRCRLILRDGLDPELWMRVRTDRRRTIPASQRVLFLDGRRYTDKLAWQIRQELKDEAMALAEGARTEVSRWICRALNDRPPNIQKRVLRHLEQARDNVATMPIRIAASRRRGKGGRYTESVTQMLTRRRREKEALREHYLNMLDAIENQHQTFYRPSVKGRTSRCFAMNPSVIQLPREIRRILLQDFYELDLSAAHLRLAAWLWGAEKLSEALDDETYSIWAQLARHIGLSLTTSVKAALKRAVYSVVFGMGRRGIAVRVTRDTKSRGAGKLFLSHPLIVELLEGRDRELDRIKVRGYAGTPDGECFWLNQKGRREDDLVDEKSVLASVAQHLEQRLMQVVLEYEADDREPDHGSFKTAFWLHDGAYVSISKGRSAKAHLERLQLRLEARANDLGVAARFELSPPLSAPQEQAKPRRRKHPSMRAADRRRQMQTRNRSWCEIGYTGEKRG